MILIAADLHNCKDIPFYDDYDAVILLGDIHRSGVEEIRKNCSVPIYYVYGNHDEYGDYDGIENCFDVHAISFQIGKSVFSGIEGSVRYKSSGVAHTQEEIKRVCNDLPPCDILLSHEGPVTPWKTSSYHVGYEGINEYITRVKPKLLIHGHRHENRVYKIGDTLCISVYKFAVLDKGCLGFI